MSASSTIVMSAFYLGLAMDRASNSLARPESSKRGYEDRRAARFVMAGAPCCMHNQSNSAPPPTHKSHERGRVETAPSHPPRVTAAFTTDRRDPLSVRCGHTSQAVTLVACFPLPFPLLLLLLLVVPLHVLAVALVLVLVVMLSLSHQSLIRFQAMIFDTPLDSQGLV